MALRAMAQSGTTTALTVLPAAKGAKSLPATSAVMSCTVRSMRRSGLSEP